MLVLNVIYASCCVGLILCKPFDKIELEDVMMEDAPVSEDLKSIQKLQQSIKTLEWYVAKQEQRINSGFVGMKRRMEYLKKVATKTLRDVTENSILAAICTKLSPPENGRMFGGKRRTVDDEAYFVCNEGFNLMGSETRVCEANRTWSGTTASCQEVNPCVSSPCINGGTCMNGMSNTFICVCNPGYYGKLCHRKNTSKVRMLDPPARLSNDAEDVGDVDVRPLTTGEERTMSPICKRISDYKRECTCPIGYKLSSDQRYCEDVDECSLFDVGHPISDIDACQFSCQNVPGSFICTCPPGHSTDDGGNTCVDIDECRQELHHCNHSSDCFNTIGGYECAAVTCPPSYVLTSPRLCERIPCLTTDRRCHDLPVTITYNFMSLPIDTMVPTRIFRLTAQSNQQSSLRFSIAPSEDSGHFYVRRHDRRSGFLILKKQFAHAKTVTVDFTVKEYDHSRRLSSSSHLAKIILFISHPLVY